MVMHVELQATCSALGYQEGDKYVKEPDCLETVKDLIRFLKREDDTCDIRRQLGDAQILQKDLLPILKNYKEDSTLFETVLRLMVNLTQPTVLCFGNKLPSDKMMRNHALEIDTHLQTYKEAFVDEELFAVLAEKVGNILKLDWENRQEEDKLLLERLLIFLRNILHIPPNPDLEQRTDDDASLHDQILWVFHVSGLEDMILYVASSENERQLCMHLLEIVSLMFREQTPESLACAGVQRSVTEKEKDERELQMIREKERAQKKLNMLKHSTRHSRFGGTYVVANMKSISDRDLIYHKSQADVQNFSLDCNKRPKKKPKNREPIKDKEITRRSTLSIRLSLKEFCVQFLENAYNPLMYAVKDNLVRERTQEHDETYYMWALKFFMEFCRHHSKRVELVSETLAVPTFHYIYTNLVTYYEMIMTEKTEAITWSKRVHLALKAYQELLLTVDMMDKSKNPQLMESAKVIKSNVFYMMEFRDIFVTLLKKFDQTKQSRTYLRDLVETTHLFVKMLEGFCKKTSHLIVQKKKQKNKKRQKPKVSAELSEPSSQELEDLWDEISGQLSAIMQGREEVPEVAPFDAASEVEVDQQRAEAMCRIQDSMRNRVPGEAVAIFRAAREVWPERDEFGTQNMPPEEEFMALREIFMAPLPKPSRSSTQSQDVVTEALGEGDEEGVHQDEEEEEERQETQVSEQEFDLTGFLVSFCKPDILKAYGVLLADFEKNSDHTNHCIIKMLHRISVDLGFTAMVFQASIFRVFQRLLLGPYVRLSRFREMIKYATFIVRRFVETAAQNKKVFMEIMFWKGSREAQEICGGYGTVGSNKGKAVWSEALEQELERLFEEFKDDPERDAVELILERLTDPSKTRGQVIGQLKRLGLINSAKDLKKKTPKQILRGIWREEEELELTELYYKFRSTSDPLGNILSSLTKRSKNEVIKKLLSMELVKDRKELHKKRSRKSGKMGSDTEDDKYRGDSDDGDNNNIEMMEGLELPVATTSDSSGSEDEGWGETGGLEEGGQQDETVGDRLRNLVEKGYREQIKWIQRGLRRSAEDREKEDYRVAVPIVPLTEENETAMEDKMFLDFLQLIGISPPANEQEAFWRIPAELSVLELTELTEGLELDGDGRPVAADKIKPVQKKKKQSRKTKKVATFQKQEEKKKKEEEKRKKQKEEKQKSKDRMNALKVLAKQRNRPSKRKRSQSKLESDSDRESDSEKENVVMETDEKNLQEASVTRDITLSKSKKKMSRVRKIVNSDSDSDDNQLQIVEEDGDNSDMSTPPPKRPKLFDSDSDEEVSQSQQTLGVHKQNKLFHSDSDSSDRDSQNDVSSVKSGNAGKVKSAHTNESSNDVPSASARKEMSSNCGSHSVNKTGAESEGILSDVGGVSVTSSGQTKRNCAIKSDDSDSDINSVDSTLTHRRVKPLVKSNEESDSEDDVPLSSKKKPSSVEGKNQTVKNTDAGKPVNNKKKNTTKGSKVKSDEKDNSTLSDTVAKKQRSLANKESQTAKGIKHREKKDATKGRKKRTKKNKTDSEAKRQSDSSSDDEPVLSKVKKLTQTKRQRVNSSSSEDDEPLSTAKTKKPKTKRQRFVESDSELSPLKLSVSQTQDATQDTSRLFNSDDESSDDEPLLNTVKSKMAEVQRSTETFPATLLTQPPGDSDSDADDHVPLRKVMQKNVFHSD